MTPNRVERYGRTVHGRYRVGRLWSTTEAQSRFAVFASESVPRWKVTKMSDRPLSERCKAGDWPDEDEMLDEIAVLEHKLIVWEKSHAALEQERDRLRDEIIGLQKNAALNRADRRERLRGRR